MDLIGSRELLLFQQVTLCSTCARNISQRVFLLHSATVAALVEHSCRGEPRVGDCPEALEHRDPAEQRQQRARALADQRTQRRDGKAGNVRERLHVRSNQQSESSEALSTPEVEEVVG